MSLKVKHIVRLKAGSGTAKVLWLGKQGSTPVALVRWDSTGNLYIVERELLETTMVPVADRVGRAKE
jgi:hypothetical protein